MERRRGTSENDLLIVQSNLASSYQMTGRLEEALRLKRDVYSGYMKLQGEECYETLLAANNYTTSLLALERYQEAKTLLRRTVPVARRVLGEGHRLALKIRWLYARVLFTDPGSTLDDLRETVATLEEVEQTARRVLGGANPLTAGIEHHLQKSRAALRACQAPLSRGA